MGYDYGKGRRTSFGIGAFLVGIYDKKNDKFLTIAKVGTGLTDSEWIEIKEKCHKFETKNKPFSYNIDKQMKVDVWIKPVIVVEIKADELTQSPIHTARYALRFPRLKRIRDDKRPDDTTTLKELEEIFKDQGVK